MKELYYFQMLRDIELEVHQTSDSGLPWVRLSDVPDKLKPALEAFSVLRLAPIAEGSRQIYAHDWLEFLKAQKKAAYEDLRRVSLRRGGAGPLPGDLLDTPELVNWIVLKDPKFDGVILLGTPRGHPTTRGPLSSTSRLCGLDEGSKWARTVTRWYKLGKQVTVDHFYELHPRVGDVSKYILTIPAARTLIATDRMMFAGH